jgi:SnoaL-like domain
MPWYDEMIGEVAAAFGRRDFGAVRRWAHPDAVFDWSRSINDVRGVYHGVDEMEASMLRFFEPWEEASWEITSVEPLDESRLLVLTHVTVRGRESGIEIEASGAQVWEHRDHKLERVTMYQDRDQALSEERGGDA